VRIVGVIPAAGYGTRLRGIPGSKEVLPVGGRPVMDYVIARMRAAGCAELRVVTRPEKRDVVARARGEGAMVLEGHPRSLVESLVTGMSGLADGDVALIGFPDSIWEPEDGYVRLVAELARGADVALGVFRFDEPERSEVVTFGDDGAVTAVAVRPLDPPGSWIWGCAAGVVSALRGMDGAAEVGEFLDSLCRRARVVAVPLSETYVDIGTEESLAAARAEPSSN
jgi:glucose-1-phosphate thymidylyltransferase